MIQTIMFDEGNDLEPNRVIASEIFKQERMNGHCGRRPKKEEIKEKGGKKKKKGIQIARLHMPEHIGATRDDI